MPTRDSRYSRSLIHRSHRRGNAHRLTKRHQLRLQMEQLEPRHLLAGDIGYNEVSPKWFQSLESTNGVAEVYGFVEAATDGVNDTTFVNDPSVRRWVVRFTEEALVGINSVAETRQLLIDGSGIDFTIIRGLGLTGQVEVETQEPNRLAVETAYSENLNVEYAVLDSLVVSQSLPSDPLVSQQWGLENSGIGTDGQPEGLADADIDAAAAFEVTTGRRDVIVSVVDSGVDYTHPDLFENVWINPGEIPASIARQLFDVDGDELISFIDLNHSINRDADRGLVSDLNGNGVIDAGDLLRDPNWADGADSDGNGFVDDISGYDFHNNDPDPFDDSGHGTHVSGTIAASGENGIGIAGVAYETTLMPLKFLSREDLGATANATRAINYATMMRTKYGQGVRVVNNSWGGAIFNQGLSDAIEFGGEADILVVAGAGNGDENRNGFDIDAQPFFPASYPSENIISVTATGRSDDLAPFANFGNRHVDLSAPGVSIISTLPTTDPQNPVPAGQPGAYGFRHGTSMAAAFVSGAAALQFAAVPHATHQEVRASILGSTDLLPSVTDREVVATSGRLNANSVLQLDTVAPRISVSVFDEQTLQGRAPIRYVVRITDDQGVDLSTIASEPGGLPDFVLREDGRPDIELFPTEIESSVDSQVVIATYLFDPPGGSWNDEDRTVYSFEQTAKGISDVSGNLNHPLRFKQIDFGEPNNTAVGTVDPLNRIVDFAVVDINQDGFDELLTIRESSSTLEILSNAEGELFTLVGSADIGENAKRIEAGDLNGNGVIDLVVLGGGTDAMVLYDFDGSNFADSQSIALVAPGNVANPAFHPTDILLADFNSDQFLDLAVTFLSHRVAISLSGTDGQLQPAEIIETSPRDIDSLVPDDLRNLDVILAETDQFMVVGEFDGMPGLDLAVSSVERELDFSVNAADDLVVLSNPSADGNLAFHRAFDLEGRLTAFAADDFNEDGVDDLLYVASSVLQKLLSAPGSTFESSAIGINFLSRNYRSIELGDFDDDSDIDAVVSELGGLRIIENDGRGRFGERVRPQSTSLLRSGDIDGDGIAEVLALVEGRQDRVQVLENLSENVAQRDTNVQPVPLIARSTTDRSEFNEMSFFNAIDFAGPNAQFLGLRPSVIGTNLFPGHDVIQLAEGNYQLSIQEDPDNPDRTGDIDVFGDLTIVGEGADVTFIDGNQLDRVFHVHPGATLTLSDLTITGGNGEAGAGIRNQGRLVIERVSIVQNQSSTLGGGLFNSGIAVVSNSTIAANSADDEGGGVYNDGILELVSSTVSSNSSSVGGGIAHSDRAVTNIDHSTITQNQAAFRGGGINGAEAEPFINPISLTDAFGGDGSQGFTITNSGAIDFSQFLAPNNVNGKGRPVAPDFDGDGFADTVVSAFDNVDSFGLVVYGKPSDAISELDVSEIDPSIGFRVSRETPAPSLFPLFGSVGDVTGDGSEDLLFPSIVAGATIPVAHVLPGSSERSIDEVVFPTDARLIEIVDSPRTMHGTVGSVFPLGDFNGDGVADVSVSSFGGTVDNVDGTLNYLLFGPLDESLEIDDSTPLIFGQSDHVVRSAGTFLGNAPNENGFVESSIMVSGSAAVGGRGAVYVFSSSDVEELLITDANCDPIIGTNNPIEFGADLSSVCAQLGTVFVGGPNEFDAGGFAGVAGDVNNDGIDDIFIAANQEPDPFSSENTRIYIIFGGQDFPQRVNTLTDLVLQDRAIRIEGSVEMDNVGDFNGDNFDDFVFDGGKLVLGKAEGLESFDAFLTPMTFAASTLTPLGDVNGDGLDDLLASGGATASVIYGRDLSTHATINVRNSIIAGNDAGQEGANIEGGVNLIGTNLVDVDPLLGPLADNGGPTLTHSPSPGSPAIDSGDNANAAATDQRGSVRVLDGDSNGSATIDIGSVEFSSFSVDDTSDSVDANLLDDVGIDSNGRKTLRAAIQQANFNPGLDSITLPAGTFAFDLAGRGEDFAATGDLDVIDDLTIIGAGIDQTFIDARDMDRVFDIFPKVVLTLRDLTITGGLTSADPSSNSEMGGGIRNLGSLELVRVRIGESQAEDGGGALFVEGGADATVTQSVFTANSTFGSRESGGGAIRNHGTIDIVTTTLDGNSTTGRGGAILNVGLANVSSSTISANTASVGGGWFQADGRALVTTSTISGNLANLDADGDGGGFFQTSGVLTIQSSTVAENTASNQGGGLIRAGGTTRLGSTLVGKNDAITGADLNGSFQSLGNNLIADGTASSGLTNGVNGDIVTVSTANLRLGPLLDNGGLTRTHALQVASPAIDSGSGEASGQRGVPRTAPDIGAYEFADNTLFVRQTIDSVDDGTLRAAIIEGNSAASPFTIVLEPGIFELSLAGTDEDSSATGDLDVANTITVIGAGVGETSIDGGELDRVFHVLVDAELILLGVQVTGGDTEAAVLDVNGGGIMNEGVLRLVDSGVSGNRSKGVGGGISNVAKVSVERSTIEFNTADGEGGGLYSFELSATSAETTILESSILDNTSDRSGGGVFAEGQVEIRRSTLARNRAEVGGGFFGDQATAEIFNSTISSNVASLEIGAISSEGGSLLLDSVTVYGNAAPTIGGVDASRIDTTIRNTIIAGNLAQDSITDGQGGFLSQGNNLFGDNGDTDGEQPQQSPAAFGFDANQGDQVGDSINPVDPIIGVLIELQINDGRTLTHALAPNSPAIDAGATSLLTDQRGRPRPFDGDEDGSDVPDIGSFELIIDDEAPQVALGAFGTVVSIGSPKHQFEIVLSDESGIDLTSIDEESVLVGKRDPSTLAFPASVRGVTDDPISGETRVTFEIDAPGGSWDIEDDGVYEISFAANGIADRNRNVVTGSPISFTVDIAGIDYPVVGTLSNSTNVPPIRPSSEVTIEASQFNLFDFSLDSQIEFYVDIDGDALIDPKVDQKLFESPLGTDTSFVSFPFVFENQPALSDRNVTILAALRGASESLGESGVLGAPTATTFLVIETDGPVGTLNAPDLVSSQSDQSYQFSVTYTDETGVDFSTLDGSDLRVIGPGEFTQAAEFVAVDSAANGTRRIATYQITPPGGTLTLDDNGFYEVVLDDAAVSDINGNVSSQRSLGGFTFEFVVPANVSGTITGTLFDDTDGNGDRGAQEQAIPNQRVFLDLNNDGEFDAGEPSSLTNNNGLYTVQYTNVPSGRYAVLAAGDLQVSSPSVADFSVTRLSDSTQPLALSLALGNFDADEAPDLVVANYNPGTLTLRMNDGKGGFSSDSVEIAGRSGPVFVEAVDVDGDLGDDIVVVNQLDNSISLFLNDGTGQFSDRHDIPLPSVGGAEARPGGMSTGDVDNDGDIDIVVSFRKSFVAILLNEGTTRQQAISEQQFFAPPLLLEVGSGQSLSALTLGQFDAGNELDLAVATFEPKRVTIFYGTGGTTLNSADDLFANPSAIDLDVIPIDLLAGNLKGSESVDIAVVGKVPAQRKANTIVLVNQGNRNFVADSQVLETEASLTSLAAADIDGDEKLDLIASTSATRNVAVFARAQSGEFLEEESNFPIAPIPLTFQYTVVAQDVDSDDRPDLLVSDATGVSILRNAVGGHVVDLNANLDFQSLDFGIQGLEMQFDFGDAPRSDQSGNVSSYPTQLSDDGARHAIGPLFLGDGVDSEIDGAPSELSNADDDDGVQFLISPIASPVASTVSSLSVRASENGFLDAWIDFNRDGDWLDENEQIATGANIVMGENTLQFAVPVGSSPGLTHARFRVSSTGGLAPSGVAGVGEVEDYAIELRAGSTEELVFQQSGFDSLTLSASPERIELSSTDVLFSAASSDAGGLRILRQDGGTLLKIDPTQLSFAASVVVENGSPNRLVLDAGNQIVDLKSVSDQTLQGIDEIDLSEPGIQELMLGSADVFVLAPSGALRVVLGEGDVAEVGLGFERDSVLLEGSRLVHSFSKDGAMISFAGPTDYTNPLNRFDVNFFQGTTSLDALAIINELSRRQFSVGGSTPGDVLPAATVDLAAFRFYDVNSDDRITALDALQVINRLAQIPNEGEGERSVAPRFDQLPANVRSFVPDREDEFQDQLEILHLKLGQPFTGDPLQTRELAETEVLDLEFEAIEDSVDEFFRDLETVIRDDHLKVQLP